MDRKDSMNEKELTNEKDLTDGKETTDGKDGVNENGTVDKKDVVYETPKPKMMFVREAAKEEYRAERLYTYEEYCTWPEDERWELIDGKAFKMEAPSEYHQQISGNLFYALRGYLTDKTCKAYAAPFDVRLDIEGIKPTVVQPDLLVICDKDILDQKGAKGAPDLVIEILSPNTAKRDKGKKLAKYEKHGVKEFWIIDPIKLNVSIYILNEFGRYDEPVIYQNRGDIIQATVLADFKISLTNIFTRENVVNNELHETIRADGAADGALEKAKQIAKNLLATGLTPEEVAKVTELDLDTILNLKL